MTHESAHGKSTTEHQSNWKASSKTDKEKREKRQITNVRNVSGDIITAHADVKRIIK